MTVMRLCGRTSKNTITAQVAESVVQERMATYLTPSPQRLYRVLMIARDNANVQLMTWGSCKR